jgi:hypothetical protein
MSARASHKGYVSGRLTPVGTGNEGGLWTGNTVSPENTSLHRLHTPETEFSDAGVVQYESANGFIAGKCLELPT